MTYSRNYAILFASRNNYILFEKLFFDQIRRESASDVLFLNIDVDSDDEQLKYGRELCDRLDINFIETDRATRPMENCVDIAIDYLDKNNIKVDWLGVFTQDAFPMNENFWDVLDERVTRHENFKKLVGSFGFNDVDRNNRFGRGNLIKGILEKPYSGWYQNPSREYLNSEYSVVESPNWNTMVINIDLFKKYITVDEDFKLHFWADDIAHQFMYNNICNVGFIDIPVKHSIDLKVKAGIPDSQEHSPLYHDSGVVEQKLWREKYGWDWGFRNVFLRTEFENVINNYKDTLQEKMFNMNIQDGPITLEEFYEI